MPAARPRAEEHPVLTLPKKHLIFALVVSFAAGCASPAVTPVSPAPTAVESSATSAVEEKPSSVPAASSAISSAPPTGTAQLPATAQPTAVGISPTAGVDGGRSAVPAVSLNGDDLLVLVNKQQGLSAGYAPPDLVDLGDIPATRSGLKIRSVALGPLRQMMGDSKKGGLQLFVLSSYRSYQEQAAIYSGYLRSMGEAQASRISAQAGKSQHQLGTTVDFTSPSVGYDLVEGFGDTPEGRWLRDNAHRYGFVMSYPAGKEPITGYAYEPWHFRYIGVDAATRLRGLGVTMEEFLSTRAAGGGG